MTQERKPLTALVMAGGGARAAYQVGVLKAVARMLPPGAPNPFPILCGTSAGAINAAALAVYARDFQDGVRRLNFIWKNFHADQVFRCDGWSLLLTGLRWFAAFALRGLGRGNPQALLDRAPLMQLLNRYMPCEHIQASIDAGALRALSVSASGYSSGQSVAFFQGVDSLQPWARSSRVGSVCRITVEHLMASSAIPFLFSSVRINREYFGDGSMRQVAPMSPALHLGAKKVFIIGVRYESRGKSQRAPSHEYPSLAQIAGHVLNSIFLDAVETDLERMERINQLIDAIPKEYRHGDDDRLRRVDTFFINPSRDIEPIAAKHAHHLPRALRLLLRSVGASHRNGANLLSYLLFERPYTRELIALGFADAMAQKDKILEFLGLSTDSSTLAG